MAGTSFLSGPSLLGINLIRRPVTLLLQKSENECWICFSLHPLQSDIQNALETVALHCCCLFWTYSVDKQGFEMSLLTWQAHSTLWKLWVHAYRGTFPTETALL